MRCRFTGRKLLPLPYVSLAPPLSKPPPRLNTPPPSSMNVNSNNIVFWLLTRIYASPRHLALIRAEIRPFTHPHISVPDITHSAPLLRAAFYECLRLDTASTTIKTVSAPFTITESPSDAFDGAAPQSYRINAGEFIHVDHGLHQTDARYYPEPAVFRPERFLVRGQGREEARRRRIRGRFAPSAAGTTSARGTSSRSGKSCCSRRGSWRRGTWRPWVRRSRRTCGEAGPFCPGGTLE